MDPPSSQELQHRNLTLLKTIHNLNFNISINNTSSLLLRHNNHNNHSINSVRVVINKKNSNIDSS